MQSGADHIFNSKQTHSSIPVPKRILHRLTQKDNKTNNESSDKMTAELNKSNELLSARYTELSKLNEKLTADYSIKIKTLEDNIVLLKNNLADSEKNHALERKQYDEAIAFKIQSYKKNDELLKIKINNLQKKLHSLTVSDVQLKQENLRLQYQINLFNQKIPAWKYALATIGVLLGTLLCCTFLLSIWGAKLIRYSFKQITPQMDEKKLPLDQFVPSDLNLTKNQEMSLPTKTTESITLDKSHTATPVTNVSIFKNTGAPTKMTDEKNNNSNPFFQFKK